MIKSNRLAAITTRGRMGTNVSKGTQRGVDDFIYAII
jgi:hypothetical protein